MPRDLPSLNALRAFDSVARLLSVSRAATELHVTHGAVSRQVRALEAELGIPLLRRHGRGIALTDAGQRLRDVTVDAFERLRAGVQTLQPAASASFVLACPGSVLSRWMIPRLARLQQALPGLRLRLAVLEREHTEVLAGVDAALLLKAPPWPPNWQVKTLATERIGPVLGIRHPHQASLRKGDLAALCREPLLHTSSRPQAWRDWARAQPIAFKRLQFGRAFEHLDYLLAAALAGLGVAIAPQHLVADDLADGRLLAPWGFRATRAHWALCMPTPHTDPRCDALAAWLRQELHDG
ncbi:MAG TPA: LysR family transcriptional regulator [Rhodanobacteraceae bacterium]|nr:LysR family transcriptional regulator [Rhodanobacteraceae bacterium]